MQTWQIGEAKITKVLEMEQEWPGFAVIPEATPENILEHEWLLGPYADPESGRIRLSFHGQGLSAVDGIPIAVRGERHMLSRASQHFDDEWVSETLLVRSIDHEGLLIKVTAFDTGDLESAVAELDRVWIEGLHQLERDGR